MGSTIRGDVRHFVGSASGLWGAAGVPNDTFTYGEAAIDVRANLGGYMYEDEDEKDPSSTQRDHSSTAK